MSEIDPGIQELHQKDVTATNDFNLELLAALWTDDAVRIVNGRVDADKNAILAENKKVHDLVSCGTSQYVPCYQTYPLPGGWAVETGIFTSLFRPTPGGPVAQLTVGKVVRLLRRQDGGLWKIVWLKMESEDVSDPQLIVEWVNGVKAFQS